MDPQVTWSDLLQAYATQNWADAAAAASALVTWLDSGGFPPQIIPGRALGDPWNRTLAYAGCRLAMSEAGWMQIDCEQRT